MRTTIFQKKQILQKVQQAIGNLSLKRKFADFSFVSAQTKALLRIRKSRFTIVEEGQEERKQEALERKDKIKQRQQHVPRAPKGLPDILRPVCSWV